jgi:hypothetical protein
VVDRGAHKLGLAVVDDAHPRARDIARLRHAQKDIDLAAEFQVRLADIQLRAIVVGLRPDDIGHRDAHSCDA